MPGDKRLKTIEIICGILLVMGLVISIQKSFRRAPSPPRVTIAESRESKTNPVDTSFLDSVVSQVTSAEKSATANKNPGSSIKSVSSPNKTAQASGDVITADEYLVGNLDTGKIYFQKNANDTEPIASISKLFASIVINKYIDPNSTIVIASSSVTGYEQAGDVYPGESFTAQDLEKGMLLISSNDAALSFANNFGYVNFMSDMNQVASSLHLTKTHFTDPSGLSPYNVSSADDLFAFARYLYKSQPALLGITRTPEFSLSTTTDHGAHDFVNIDPFVYDPHYLGGKTGRTDAAGETMLSLFNLPDGNGDIIPVAVVVLHSNQDTRQIDSSMLIVNVLSAIKAL
ncbi:MAG: D-alanyl-D-alanine carboxypeptidase [Patescibacteria group bacterium]|nr:D-alanyl-D-alanine carboxypeptidase [Patescibacteria group bacterium]